jgi:nucleoside-diphosphate-sugar epimerase
MSEIKRLLVTGGTGCIGHQAVKILKDKNYDVVVASRQDNSRDCYRMDILDMASVNRAMQDIRPSHLLHFAWNMDGAHHENIYNLNWLVASLHLLSSFSENGGERAVFAGTVSEYNLQYGFLSEDITPLNPSLFYGRAKACLYMMAKEFAQRAGINYAHGRIFYTFGEHDKEYRLIPSIVRDILKGRQPNVKTPNVVCDYSYSGDIGKMFVRLLESEVCGAVNLASGVGVKISNIVEKIARLLDFDLRPFPAVDSLTPPIIANIARLTKEVGWQPSMASFDEGLKRTVEWHRQLSK